MRGGGRRRRAEFTELGWSVSRSQGGLRGGALGGESLSKRIRVGLREKKVAESQPVEFVWYRNKRQSRKGPKRNCNRKHQLFD